MTSGRRDGRESVGLGPQASIYRSLKSEGVVKIYVETLHRMQGRWFIDGFQPYDGGEYEMVPVGSGKPPANPRSNTREAYEDKPHECLQAILAFEAGTCAPYVVGWILPYDSTEHASSSGSRAKVRPGVSSSKAVSKKTKDCDGFQHWISDDVRDEMLSGKDGTTLMSSVSFASLRLSPEGRASISVSRNPTEADCRILFQLISAASGDDAGYIGFTKFKTSSTADCAPAEAGVFGKRLLSTIQGMQDQLNFLVAQAASDITAAADDAFRVALAASGSTDSAALAALVIIDAAVKRGANKAKMMTNETHKVDGALSNGLTYKPLKIPTSKGDKNKGLPKKFQGDKGPFVCKWIKISAKD